MLEIFSGMIPVLEVKDDAVNMCFVLGAANQLDFPHSIISSLSKLVLKLFM